MRRMECKLQWLTYEFIQVGESWIDQTSSCWCWSKWKQIVTNEWVHSKEWRIRESSKTRDRPQTGMLRSGTDSSSVGSAQSSWMTMYQTSHEHQPSRWSQYERVIDHERDATRYGACGCSNSSPSHDESLVVSGCVDWFTYQWSTYQLQLSIWRVMNHTYKKISMRSDWDNTDHSSLLQELQAWLHWNINQTC
jgi:hypothetical protein